MTLTLHDIKVWNTGEVIDLVVPSDTDASVSEGTTRSMTSPVFQTLMS